MNGKFITIEGIDGAGKSTHIPFITGCAIQICKPGTIVRMTREPGGTPLGETLRNILLNEKMSPKAEALLMFASRAEHLNSIIKPALENEEWIISDRFTDSSFAYQGAGRGILEVKMEQLEWWVQDDFQPDLTLLFDVTLDVSKTRLLRNSEKLDKFEKEQDEFFNKVRNAYLKRASKFPDRIKIIDSSKTIEEVKDQIVLIMNEFAKTL